MAKVTTYSISQSMIVEIGDTQIRSCMHLVEELATMDEAGQEKVLKRELKLRKMTKKIDDVMYVPRFTNMGEM
jgi:hypothetical protein